MKYIYMLLIAVLVVLVFIFAVENIEVVRISFLTVQLRMPLSLLAILIYFAGMLTGGFLVALVRKWIRGASR